ncbi:glycosyltransferase [Patescibacteria group bacterium]|nr:glycosyltransferase [Patescibacteria group bacterium]
MKILHLIPSYVPARLASGPINAVHNLNTALVKRGVSVTVYTTDLDGPTRLKVPLNQERLIDGVRVVYFPITFRFWQYSRNLHHRLAATAADFDAIHITSVFLSISTLGAYYAKKFGRPYLISPHGSLMKYPLSQSSLKKRLYLALIECRNLKGAVIHLLAKKERQDFLDLRLPCRGTVVVPNGLNMFVLNALDQTTAFRKRFKIPDNKKIILFIGRLNKIKGLDTLIPAFAEVVEKEPDAFLLIAGSDDGYKKQVESLIAHYRLQQNVSFVGFLLGGDKKAAMEASTVFVQPSYTESVSMALIEAMAAGLPVVVTDSVGISSDIEIAAAGLVVPKESHLLAQALIDILTGKQNGREMGQNGRQLVSEQFTLEATGQAMEAAYRRIIDG